MTTHLTNLGSSRSGAAPAPGSHRLAVVAPRRVAVLRALPGLGDLLCLVPALRALRAALPGVQIVLIGLPLAAGFVQRFSVYLDGLLEFPGLPGIPEVPLDLARFPRRLAALQRQNFDVLLQVHGNGSLMNIFAGLVGASLTAGFYRPGDHCPNPETFLPYPEAEPEIWRHLRLLDFLGIPLQGEHLEFPVSADDERALAEALGPEQLAARQYVCLHPGARDPARRWPPERFAAVGDALDALGFLVVITGTAGERPVTRAVVRAMRAQPLDLAGRTSLGALAALLRDARLVVCNDTGVSHLAAALSTPSVVVFGDPQTIADPVRWAPLDRQRHRSLVPATDPARIWENGLSKAAANGHSGGGHVVAAHMVLAEVGQLLAEDRGRHG